MEGVVGVRVGGRGCGKDRRREQEVRRERLC
jgi:hypothetical protein